VQAAENKGQRAKKERQERKRVRKSLGENELPSGCALLLLHSWKVVPTPPGVLYGCEQKELEEKGFVRP
jgi:hypothetical protein